MATYSFTEIPVDPVLFDGIADDDGEYYSYNYANWYCVKSIAKRYLTRKQYEVVAWKVERGWRQTDIARVQGCSQQAVSERYRRAVFNLKKVFDRYEKNKYNKF